MKKMKLIAVLTAMTLLFGACAQPEPSGPVDVTPQITADVTEEPEMTEAPIKTEAPTPTEVPGATETPEVTEVPEITEAPVVTEAPEVTEVPEPTATAVPTATPEPTATAAPTATPVPTVTAAPAETPEPTKEPNAAPTAAEVISQMTIGWNLGNTLDSKGKDETAWGQPMTTQAMIDKVAEAGFNTVRIPTTWSYRADADMNVQDDWMERVAEVVDYCYANDMYVILNTHHEGEWIIPDAAHADDVEKKFIKLWEQIAERFKDYDEHLIFEGLNEPRVEGGENEWNGGTPEGRAIVNRLEKAFIETVRASGGNNKTRCLLVTSFAASSSNVAMQAIELPENDPYVGVSIHAYTPYNFTFDTQNQWNTMEWSENVKKEINVLMLSLNRTFISKGIPVALTEFGAVNKAALPGGENNPASRCEWVTYYVSKAKEYGIPCVYWDNALHTGSGELFGLLNRRTLEWYEPEYVEAMTNAAKK